jgi:hypothetical protein
MRALEMLKSTIVSSESISPLCSCFNNHFEVNTAQLTFKTGCYYTILLDVEVTIHSEREGEQEPERVEGGESPRE